MPLRDHWWCILVAKYGAFLFTEIGAVVITDYIQSGHYIGIKNNPITDGSSNSLTPQLTQTYHLLLEKKSISEISEIRGFTKDTIYKHTLKIVEINGIDCIHHIRPDDTTIMKVHDAVTELENNTLLKPIYEYLNERVSYLSLIHI